MADLKTYPQPLSRSFVPHWERGSPIPPPSPASLRVSEGGGRGERSALLALSALFLLAAGCFRQNTPPPAPVSTPSIYGGDRSGDGGLIKNAPVRRPGGSFGGATPAPSSDVHLVLGNPDGASKSENTPEHFLVTRTQYALSYNDTLRYPNWVSWRLVASDIGNIPRGTFAPDPDLPFNAVKPSDYTHSGYDRGHNCPSKDRSATKDDNDIVFYMSNMTPQLHEMNAGAWEKLEMYTRSLASRGNTCYVICGHAGSQEPLRSGVAVPTWGWKVVVAVPDGANLDASCRVIAVKVPNVKGEVALDDRWEQYAVTVAELEENLKADGKPWNLLSGLPAETADALKAKKDEGGGSFGGSSGGSARSTRRRSGGSFGQ